MEVVRIEMTPNPNAKKFVLAEAYFAERGSFVTREQAQGCPLATALFAVAGVDGVMWLGDFVTISKRPEAQWKSIAADVRRELKKVKKSSL